jgi:hypothetical protein
MSERRSVVAALAGTLVLGGVTVLIYGATERGDLSWWTDPVFWIGVVALVAGALMYAWLLIPPWLREHQAWQARTEQQLLEGRANQRQGLEEILSELGQISSQLKAELRWGKRGPLFPNTAWTKNEHLLASETRTLVDSAYQQAHLLDKATLSALHEELDKGETEERQRVKQLVDGAAQAVSRMRDEVSS